MDLEWNRTKLAKTIDHTLLKATANEQQIKDLCTEAKKFGFSCVCVNPYWVKYCAKELEASDVQVCAVVGFPLGANCTETKAFETALAVKDGADEIDMVINISAVKAGKWDYVENDIIEVAKAAGKALVKVIIETCYLDTNEKIKLCNSIVKAGCQFVKTSTGFGTAGASIEDVRLFRKTIGDAVKIKASGGIRTYNEASQMLEAGADRLGSSSGVAILSEMPE
jgi:deoxyribose-phosphate aldolase